MYSRTFSCGVIGAYVAPEPSVEQFSGKYGERTLLFETWKSLNTTRPHWLADAAPTGVLNA